MFETKYWLQSKTMRKKIGPHTAMKLIRTHITIIIKKTQTLRPLIGLQSVHVLSLIRNP